MPTYVHALVKDTDYDNARIREAVEHDMSPDRVFEVSFPDIDGTSGLSTRSQVLECIDDSVVVSIRLFQ